MNKNGVKVVIAVICLGAAAAAIMWNMGLIGGSAPVAPQGAAATGASGADPSQPAAVDTSSNSGGNAGQLKKVNY